VELSTVSEPISNQTLNEIGLPPPSFTVHPYYGLVAKHSRPGSLLLPPVYYFEKVVGIVVVFLSAFFMVVFVRNKIFILVSIRLTHFHRHTISPREIIIISLAGVLDVSADSIPADLLKVAVHLSSVLSVSSTDVPASIDLNRAPSRGHHPVVHCGPLFSEVQKEHSSLRLCVSPSGPLPRRPLVPRSRVPSLNYTHPQRNV
jgi:hypothetical protein